VIHDFWVPAFRMKIDAVPGIDTHLRVTTTDRLGEFPVVCAELCGLGHSAMRQSAHVVSREDYDARLAELARGPAAGGGGGEGGGGEADGATLFAEAAQPQACGACHTLADAGTTATTGPNLDEAVPGMSPEDLEQAITDPDAEVAEGFQGGLMPRYGDTLSPEQVDALVEYLTEVAGK
jgi:cytochrome c oxidase subunit 2